MTENEKRENILSEDENLSAEAPETEQVVNTLEADINEEVIQTEEATQNEEAAQIIDLVNDDDILPDGTSIVVDDALISKAPKSRTGLNMLISILILGLIVGVIFLVYFLMDAGKKEFGFTFNGQNVSTEELKLFTILGGSDATTGLDNAGFYYSMEYGLNLYDIKPTDDDKVIIEDEVKAVKDFVANNGFEFPKVSDKRLMELFAVSALGDKLYDAVCSELVVTEDETQTAFADYLLNNRADYYDIQLKYIFTETEDEANNARNEIINGENIDDVIAKYSLSYTEGEDAQTVGLADIGFEQSISNQILELTVGDVSEAIEYNGAYLLLYIVSYNIPEQSEVETTFRANYEDQMKYYYFMDRIDLWLTAGNLTPNQDAIDNMTFKYID